MSNLCENVNKDFILKSPYLGVKNQIRPISMGDLVFDVSVEVHESSLLVAHPGYQALSEILFKLYSFLRYKGLK